MQRLRKSTHTKQVSSENAAPSASIGVTRYCASGGGRSKMVFRTALHVRSAVAKRGREGNGCNNQPRRAHKKNRSPGKLHTHGNACAGSLRARAFAGSGECAARPSAGARAETGSEKRRRDRCLLRKPDMTRLRSCRQGLGGNGLHKRERLRGRQIGLDRRGAVHGKGPSKLPRNALGLSVLLSSERVKSEIQFRPKHAADFASGDKDWFLGNRLAQPARQRTEAP